MTSKTTNKFSPVHGEFVITLQLAFGTDRGNGAAKRSDQGRHEWAAVCRIVLIRSLVLAGPASTRSLSRRRHGSATERLDWCRHLPCCCVLAVANLAHAQFVPPRPHCVPGHRGLELRNPCASYLFEILKELPLARPRLAFRDYLRVSCGVVDARLGRVGRCRLERPLAPLCVMERRILQSACAQALCRPRARALTSGS
jgi:hypothetical protein